MRCSLQWLGGWLTHYNISWQTKLSFISVAIWTLRTVFTGRRKPLATGKSSMVRRWKLDEFHAHLMIRTPGLLFPERQCYIRHILMGNGLLAHTFWWRRRSARSCGLHHLQTCHETFTKLRVYHNPCTLTEMEMNMQKEMPVIYERNSRKIKKINCLRCAQLWLDGGGGTCSIYFRSRVLAIIQNCKGHHKFA